MVSTGHWATYTDWEEMWKEVIEREPQVHRFGVLAGSSLAFDWMYHWFDDEQDFRQFQARARELTDQSIGSIEWMGTLDELASGDSEQARECRRAFWELQGEQADDEDTDEAEEDEDSVDEIPDELMGEFVASLYPDWWTGG